MTDWIARNGRKTSQECRKSWCPSTWNFWSRQSRQVHWTRFKFLSCNLTLRYKRQRLKWKTPSWCNAAERLNLTNFFNAPKKSWTPLRQIGQRKQNRMCKKVELRSVQNTACVGKLQVFFNVKLAFHCLCHLISMRIKMRQLITIACSNYNFQK